MAWTDACRIEACAQIDKRKPHLSGAKPAIREVSNESGIPIRTLERWYWPDRSAKTGVPYETVDIQLETCTIADLQILIDDSKKLGTI